MRSSALQEMAVELSGAPVIRSVAGHPSAQALWTEERDQSSGCSCIKGRPMQGKSAGMMQNVSAVCPWLFYASRRAPERER